MKLVDHLSRFLPGDLAVMALDEDTVLAALETWGLVTALQQSWTRQEGLVPFVRKRSKLAESAWANTNELLEYFEMALEEGRERGYEWATMVPLITARIPKEGRDFVLFVLGATLYERRTGALQQEYLFDAFLQALEGDRDAIIATIDEHYRDHFDYTFALQQVVEHPLMRYQEDEPGRFRDELIDHLERCGMRVRGTRPMTSEELRCLPPHHVMLCFDDYSGSASLFVIPEAEIPCELLDLVERDSISFANSDDVSMGDWWALCRLLSLFGEDIGQRYDDMLGHYAHIDGCPTKMEIEACLNQWIPLLSMLFESSVSAPKQNRRDTRLNTRLVGLCVVNRGM